MTKLFGSLDERGVTARRALAAKPQRRNERGCTARNRADRTPSIKKGGEL